jgi:predicted RNase H-like nuclease
LEQARARNLLELGKSLSAQAWGICPKIAEVDILLSTRPAVRELVKEVHPELSFCALNGGRPMQFSKKRQCGSIERLAILQQLEPGAPDLIERTLSETRRADLGRDDVHDALVAMLTAGAGPDLAFPLPEDRQVDEIGLRMRMWMPAQRCESRGA